MQTETMVIMKPWARRLSCWQEALFEVSLTQVLRICRGQQPSEGAAFTRKECEAQVCLSTAATLVCNVLNQSCTTMADALSLLWNLVLEDQFRSLAQSLVKPAHQILTEDLKHIWFSHRRRKLAATRLTWTCFCCVPADGPSSDGDCSGLQRTLRGSGVLTIRGHTLMRVRRWKQSVPSACLKKKRRNVRLGTPAQDESKKVQTCLECVGDWNDQIPPGRIVVLGLFLCEVWFVVKRW